MSKHNEIPVSSNGNSPSLTPIENFRALRVHGRVSTLKSSGRVVRWRPVHLARLLKAGKIPDHLSTFVTELVWAGVDEEDSRTPKEKAIEWQDYLDWISASMLMFPRVSDDPQGDDEIAPEDLYYEEQIELERMARRPLDEVRPFPAEQAQHVEPGPEGERVEQATQ